MNYKIRTLALSLLAVAAGNSAWAQQPVYAQQCKPYTLTGTAAEGSGNITYQWYRNGQPIANANGKDYTMPPKQAYGEDVEFKRGVMSDGCPGKVDFSDAIRITFSGGLRVDTLCWAHTNVDAPNTFAPKPDMFTKFYQWNIPTAWSATDVTVVGWNPVPDESETWTFNPCPDGWRLPTQHEYQLLNNQGTVWADAYTRGNAVAGRFCGPKYATCSLPNNMEKCIFLPAVGSRNKDTGTAYSLNIDGYYWTSTQSTTVSTNCLCMRFNAAGYNFADDFFKTGARNIRCVQ